MQRENGAIEQSGRNRRAGAITPIYLSGLTGLTLATCAEVERVETDLNRNNADSYSAAERERALQEDFGKC